MQFSGAAYRNWFFLLLLVLGVSGCAGATVPDPRNVDIPAPTIAEKREKAVNENPDSVMYLPLGDDILVPEAIAVDPMPADIVGPFELRGETLAGALQLILADYDISMAFETEEGLTRRVTVANLRGPLNKVVNRVCSMADLYCLFEDGMLIIKDTQTFTVTLPPIGDDADDTDFLDNVSEGLGGVLGEDADEPIIDETTRTLIYSATHRTAELASRYFQRLRANTALIVFETYIWEVSLNAGNSTGIDYDRIDAFGKFNTSFSLDGGVGADFTNPLSIGFPTTQVVGVNPTDFVQFLSQFGAVKTISQPKLAVLSGGAAELRVADTENFVSEITTTLDQGQSTTSVSTDSVDTGFTLTIGSTWDKATVYANIDFEETNVLNIDNFTFSDGGDDGVSTIIQLPQTTERQITTQVRMRPGDSLLLAGLVRETDNYDTEGPGFMKPVLPQSRTTQTTNLELVILMKPRVIAYTAQDDERFINYVEERNVRAKARMAAAQPAQVGTAPQSSVMPVEAKAMPPAEYKQAPVTAMTPAYKPMPEPAMMPEPAVAELPPVTEPLLTQPPPILQEPVAEQMFTEEAAQPELLTPVVSPSMPDSEVLISSEPVSITPLEEVKSVPPPSEPETIIPVPNYESSPDEAPSPYESFEYYVPSY